MNAAVSACSGAAPVLRPSRIGKKFGAIRAPSDVDPTINAGHVVGLIGDNGVGKSPLGKIIAGNLHPTRGTIRFDGRERRFDRRLDARNVGIKVVCRDLAVANTVSAAASGFLGRETVRKIGPFAFLDRKPMNARALALFTERKSETRPRDLFRQMSGGQRRTVAVARTRFSDSKLVPMDEPVKLFDAIKQ